MLCLVFDTQCWVFLGWFWLCLIPVPASQTSISSSHSPHPLASRLQAARASGALMILLLLFTQWIFLSVPSSYWMDFRRCWAALHGPKELALASRLKKESQSQQQRHQWLLCCGDLQVWKVLEQLPILCNWQEMSGQDTRERFSLLGEEGRSLVIGELISGGPNNYQGNQQRTSAHCPSAKKITIGAWGKHAEGQSCELGWRWSRHWSDGI